MSDLKKEFAEIYNAIGEYSDTSMRSSRYHYPLVDIMRKLNGDGSTIFNPGALIKSGISPQDFRKAWALGFAQETLGYYDNRFTSDVVVKRCEACLNTRDEYAFGNFLSRDMKVLLESKLMKNQDTHKQEALPTLNIA